MPVVGPLVGSGISLLGGLFGSKKNAQQKQALAAQQQAMSMLTGAGNMSSQFAKDQYSLASPAYSSALSYYSKLLYGDRAVQNQALAAPRASITDLYRGAEKGLDRGMLRGGERDLARAELNRDRVGSLAKLTTGVQPQAAASLADLAGQGFGNARGFMGNATDAFGSAGRIAAGAYDQGTAERDRNAGIWGGVGKSLYDIWGPIIKKRFPKWGF